MGRELLPRLAACDLALGVSDFNRRDLVAAGFAEERTGVLPICPSGQLTGSPEDPALLARLRDGKLNLLFVGRVVPNKRVDDLVRLFRHYHNTINASSRLIVVGSLANTYADYVIDLAKRFQLDDKILFLGKVDDASLKTCYTSSHFYISMSEHEGFCVPLLEAFACDLPVFAYAAGAVPETMGDAGVVFERKAYPLLCEVLENVRGDRLLKERIVAAQRRRLEDFGETAFRQRLDEVLGRFLN
jgi:glycosyltransferase involved in cell wall biosynthesis